jgi:hypothetical protein
MKYKNTSNAAAIIWLTIVIALCYGWIANVITIAQSDFSTFTGMLILRIAGIFVAPLGAILGYI